LAETIDQQEFLQLINTHQALLHKVCRVYCDDAIDRQDLFQEIVIQSWKAYPNFRREAKFSTWLYRIALNTAISDLRKKDRRVRLSFPENAPEITADYSGDEKDEQLKSLYAAISLLGEIEKAIVMLYLEDKSYEEMEDILGINQNNLRVKMNRIKEKLRKLTKSVEHGIG
jgi:RNA polymerase sigma-70 factor (ECF subfamily)